MDQVQRASKFSENNNEVPSKERDERFAYGFAFLADHGGGCEEGATSPGIVARLTQQTAYLSWAFALLASIEYLSDCQCRQPSR